MTINKIIRLVKTFNIQLQIGCDPDQPPLERQVRVEDPTKLNPLLQV